MMNWSLAFIINSELLGVGLAMDAFSVSLANGLNEPCMRKRKMTIVAGVFAVFQALMPMIGWVCVHTVAEHFKLFEKFIPWIALGLLLYIGINMLKEALEKDECCGCCDGSCADLSVKTMFVMAVATSIDALAVGISLAMAGNVNIFVAVLLIGVVTFAMSAAGVKVGNVFGIRYKSKAELAGGAILILMGTKILLEHLGIL